MTQPALQTDADAEQSVPSTVIVTNLSPEQTAALRRFAEDDCHFRDLLTVHVAPPQELGADPLPPIVGQYALAGNALRFTPWLPFEPGVPYRAIFRPEAFPMFDPGPNLTYDFHISSAPTVPPQVRQIFPTSDTLPENLLRFYIVFSLPMQRGQAQAQIALLGPDGQQALDALYRSPVELWDSTMRVLTVLLDPGRLKRGVGPNRALGPPIREGEQYTLLVGAGMLAEDGSSLAEPARKSFRVTSPVREPIGTAQWRFTIPLAGSRGPLVLHVAHPLDWALLGNCLTVVAHNAPELEGQIRVDDAETRWNFTPSLPWLAGSFQLHIHSDLEDVCGNTMLAPFDRPMRSGSNLHSEQAVARLPFTILTTSVRAI